MAALAVLNGVLAQLGTGGAGGSSVTGGAGATAASTGPSILTSMIIWLPLLGALIVLFLPNRNDNDAGRIKSVAAMITGFDLVLAMLAYWTSFSAINDFSWSGGYRFEEQYGWLGFGASYHVGLDGISLPMVLLSALLFFVAVLASWNVKTRVKEYFFLVLVMQIGVTGVFCAADYLLFFVFWEIELIPMFLLILVWGGARRVYAAWKFLLFTITASAFLLLAILVMYFRDPVQPASFDMAKLTSAVYPSGVAAVIFVLFFICFAIKLPAWPVHTWLPDAHVEAPTAMSVLLAGILLKMGGYGIIRVCVNQFPATAKQFSLAILAIGVIGVLWGGFAALRQDDMKRMVAYSSVSHMGFVLVGVSGLTPLSLNGAVFQLFAHGVITGSLFLLVGLVYDRTHTRSIRELGGLAEKAPYLAIAWVLAALAAVGLPGFAGFIAEFEIFVGTFGTHKVGTFLAVFGVVLSAGYMLWMLQRVFFGPIKEQWTRLKDVGLLEGAYMVGMLIVIFLAGVAPGLLDQVINFGVNSVIARVGTG
jgi:NADH-quinone oxidoreductase subunit M